MTRGKRTAKNTPRWAMALVAGGLVLGTAAAAPAANPWGPSARGVAIAQPRPDDNTIAIANGYRFDPLAGEPAIPAALRGAAPAANVPGYFLAQGHAPLSGEFAAALRAAGAEPLEYMSNSAYVVRATPEVAARLSRDPAIRWVGLFQPAYRLSSALRGAAGAAEPVVAVVFEGGDVAAVRSGLESLGATIRRVDVNRWDRLIYADLDGGALTAAARLGDVAWIEPDYVAREDNDKCQWVIQTDSLNYRRIWDMGLTGAGQVMSEHDSGINTNHCAFYDPSVPITDFGDYPTHRKIIAYARGASQATFGDESGHGTHTNGTSVGDDSTASLKDGMAKSAKTYFTDGGMGGSSIYHYGLNQLYLLSYNGNAGGAARICSNSWGGGTGGAYDVSCHQADQFMWEHPDYLLFYSDGNDGPAMGTVHSPATSKDVCSIGATLDGSSANRLASYSSRGPCADGRYKPTLCTPGDNLSSANYNSACGYVGMSGTSMATPAAAGGTVLIREYLTEGWYPTGAPVPANAIPDPSAALMKAMAVNCAANDVQGYTIPDNNIGWGRMLLDNVLYFPGDAQHLLLHDETAGLNTGDYQEFTWNVESSSVPMRVALVWTDYPGTQGAAVELVNDLDLVVTAPNGTTQYLGNVWSGGQSVTGGSADHLNVEECVGRNAPEVGTWRARVSATAVPQGPQPFALVVTAGGSLISSSVNEGAAPAPKSATLLASAGPNPVTRGDAGTVIRYYLPREGDVRLGIYDVRGREVRSLVASRQSAGQQAAAWDTRDAGGVPVASGLYFYRLETPSGILKDKLVITR